ncbi:MAG: hypothetical protein WBA76_06105, partial [Phormidesmis sp.]
MSLAASASPVWAQASSQMSPQPSISEADTLDDAEVSAPTLAEIETPEIEDSVVENAAAVTATVSESIEENTRESVETAEAQAVASSEASEVAMSEFVRALSADLAEAQAAAAETSAEALATVVTLDPLLEAPEGLLESEATADRLAEELEILEEV